MYEKQKRYRLKHRNKINKNLLLYWRRKRKLIAEFKNRPCTDCGGWFHPVQMDFDHRPDEIKKFTISAAYCLKFKTLYKEIQKCDIVCANCHRLRTYRRNQHGASNKVLTTRDIDRNQL